MSEWKQLCEEFRVYHGKRAVGNKVNRMKRVNIVLVEYINRNLGDTVIAECTRFFLEEALEQAGIENYRIQAYNMYSKDMTFIRFADAVIFAGGGLIKYKRENFHRYIPDIIEVTEKYNIPVYFNCVGVEDYDEADERCLRLKHSVNQTCVKGITVRDDFEILAEKYLESEKEWLDKTLDPAAFASEVYQYKGKKGARKIGLGISQDHLFRDYGSPFITRAFQLDFWKGIIDGLQREGYEWEIFTNGWEEDNKFALEILEYAGIEEIGRHLVCRPVEGRELAGIISGYAGVIAVRLHANIIAFSMGVPSIGLVWNEKMLRWGEASGYPERFIKAEEIGVERVLNALKSALEEGCRECTPEERARILIPLTAFLRKYGRSREDGKCYLQENFRKEGWENVLIANALGGKNFLYCGMNSPKTIFEKYEDGFRWFEADVKLTSDGKAVCVNGWGPSSVNKLGMEETQQEAMKHGICYEEFMKLKYYNGHYDVMDYEMLIHYLRDMPGAQMILDVRYSTPAEMQKIAGLIQKSMQKDQELKKRLILRVMERECMETAKVSGLKMMFDLPLEEERKTKGIGDIEIDCCCREKGVEWISIRRQLCTEDQIKKLKKYKKKICVFLYNSLSETVKFLSWGGDMVATDYLSVEGLNCLTEAK